MASWVNISPSSDFSLANIPFGIISTKASPSPHAAVAIGDYALDLPILLEHIHYRALFLPILGEEHLNVFSKPTLNAFAALGREVHRRVRSAIQELLTRWNQHSYSLRDNLDWQVTVLLPLAKVQMHLPMQIGDYTDFYAGIYHAERVGRMFRGPANALQPNYKHLPVGYHGRSSSIVVSGTDIYRPVGQIIPDPVNEPGCPIISASRKMDFELELGCFICKPNEMGIPIGVNEAEEHIFGYVLLNDWSARDIQAWEYVPLGPFNGKNFATTISPWVVLADALEPFRVPGLANDTEVQPYLVERRLDNAFDIHLSVHIKPASVTACQVTGSQSQYLLWSFPQMIAHHTLGGCPMRTGDLLGSGTISGELRTECGSMLEASQNGKLTLETASEGVDGRALVSRTFLEDGDIVTFRGFAEIEDDARVGFGVCEGRILPAPVPFSSPSASQT